MTRRLICQSFAVLAFGAAGLVTTRPAAAATPQACGGGWLCLSGDTSCGGSSTACEQAFGEGCSEDPDIGCGTAPPDQCQGHGSNGLVIFCD